MLHSPSETARGEDRDPRAGEDRATHTAWCQANCGRRGGRRSRGCHLAVPLRQRPPGGHFPRRNVHTQICS